MIIKSGIFYIQGVFKERFTPEKQHVIDPVFAYTNLLKMLHIYIFKNY